MPAIISECTKYRYLLERNLNPESDKNILFIMLNPSTADAEKDDATIRRCIGFSQKIGNFNRLQVVNLFAFRASKPKDLFKADLPYGPDNVSHQTIAIQNAHTIVCAWGTNGAFNSEGIKMVKSLDIFKHKVFALDVTKQGHPKHPLFVPYDVSLKSYKDLLGSESWPVSNT